VTPDLKDILLCMYDPTSPESVAAAWVVKHACMRDQIPLQLHEQRAAAPLVPEFFDRLTLIAGITWTSAEINLIARHAIDVVLFPAITGFESYDSLRTASPYRDWVRDGYTVKEIGSAFAQHVGQAAVTREAHHAAPAIHAWMYFTPGVPAPSFLTLASSVDFKSYDEAYRAEARPATGGSEPTLIR